MITAINLITQATQQLAAVGIETPRLDAELLLAHVLGKERVWLWTYPDYGVAEDGERAFRQLLARRCQREPLAYLLGEWEFYGRSFRVTPAVLIPRPETELLVEAVITWARYHPVNTIVDVGTGSGAIAITLAAEMPSVQLMAIDLSPAALRIAEQNAERYHLTNRIEWLQGFLLQPVVHAVTQMMDVVVANLPYIAEEDIDELMPEVRDYEPRLALAASAGGLQLIYDLIDTAPAVLCEGGLLALEVGDGQAEPVQAYLATRHWQRIQIIHDYAGISRHVLAER